MEENGPSISEQSKPTGQRESRLRKAKEHQNDDRARKLEEIKAQVLAAQIYQEQKEQDRRRRLEEIRIRDEERRRQVEERKRAINDAEKDRLEFLLKRSQGRDHLMESKKKNERSNIVFAFGSSTPRMLDGTDTSVSYWSSRRATSIQNIASVNPSSINDTEKDADVGSKKRASSATGLERTELIPAGCVSGNVGRRRTDLVPTIPVKDSSLSSSPKSLNRSPGRAYSMTRLDQLAQPRKRHDMQSSASSGISEASHNLAQFNDLKKSDSRSMQQLNDRLARPRPNRTTQMREQKLLSSSNGSEASSRPSSSLSQRSTNSVASSVGVKRRVNPGPRRARPASIAGTGVTNDLKLDSKPPLPKKPSEKIPSKSRTKASEDRTSKTTVKNVTGKSDSRKTSDKAANGMEKSDSNNLPPNENKRIVNGKLNSVLKNDLGSTDVNKLEPDSTTLVQVNEILEKSPLTELQPKDNELNVEKTVTQDLIIIEEQSQQQGAQPTVIVQRTEELVQSTEKNSELTGDLLSFAENSQSQMSVEASHPAEPIRQIESPLEPSKITSTIEIIAQPEKNTHLDNLLQPVDNTPQDATLPPENEIEISKEMTTSMSKSRITTEEEAKAALAERRRLIREEAERQAELEKLRIEAEAKAELERQRQEEEQIRQLIELQKKNEQERLQEAIRETQKLEEEERLRKEEEHRLRLIKEEADKKAREEAERQKAELQEKLKNEEKEREARRKRVEAIMLRTRGKNNVNLTSPSVDEKNGNQSEGINDIIEIEKQENGTTKIADDIVDNL